LKKKLKKNIPPQLQEKKEGGYQFEKEQKTLAVHSKEVEKSIRRLKRYQINKEVMKPRTHKEALKSTTSAQQGNIENH